MKAINLRTEYLVAPMGLDIREPRFFWNCEDGIKQSAYWMIAERDGIQYWDSGKVQSASMTHIKYAGEKLKSRDRIDWKVKLWDKDGTEGEWVSSWFEMGLLEKSDWSAKWITGNYSPKKNSRYPVDCFKKEFTCKKPMKSARLYITACGLYEAKINGLRAGEFHLAPGTTDYRKRLYYQTYNVTAMLAAKSTLEIQLADGWYRGSVGAWGFRAIYGRQTKLLCQLEITYLDNTGKKIISDESFLWSNDGTIRFADLKDGEIIDANLTPSYSNKAKVTNCRITPTASNNVEPKEHEIFTPNLLITPGGAKVLDFGQNIAGFISFSVKGKKGQKIRLLTGETLDKNGEFTQGNFLLYTPVKEVGIVKELMLISGKGDKLNTDLQPTPKQEIVFTCKGGIENYKTKFAVFGFRYALIETDIDFNPADFKAIAVYSAMEQTGSFKCSNTKINRLVSNTLWSMKGNFLDIPTDCPTRERLGWTGEAQAFFNTGAYLMNVPALFKKWLKDLSDTQFKTGKTLAVAPYNGNLVMYKTSGGSVGWGCASVLIPYRYWKRYGDKDILREFYPMMRNYALYMIKRTGHKKIKAARSNPYNKYVYEKGFHFGEWIEPEEFKEVIGPGVDVIVSLHINSQHK
jgi:alpha-L-rhamnosidase